MAVAFEAGRGGFWLARWLRARGVEAEVIHPISVAVSRERRRAKTDRLDTELLKRAGPGAAKPCLQVRATSGVSASPWRPTLRAGAIGHAVIRGPRIATAWAEDSIMAREQDNKTIVGRWFKEFWGNPWNPGIVDELATPDMLLQYSLHAPRRGREDVKSFMTGFREAFPDLCFEGVADLIAEVDFVVGRWKGGGTHTGPTFSDFLLGSLPAASGRKMHFTGTTVLRVENGKIAEEVGLDDGVTALQQLGLIRAA
ncbi:MAG TPA: ester cyclase [Crenalkalicoccus sp.]|jgi:predicted ester cyclase|nr:ester cyclase [Crenalkalicoccus sp.]